MVASNVTTDLIAGHPNDSHNLADLEEMAFDENLWQSMNKFSIVSYSLVFILGVTGNGLVIFITGFRMKKTVNTVFFLNLAIADFTFTFFLSVSIMYLAWGIHWPFGGAMCKLHSTVVLLNLYASVYLLTVISIDRFIFVMHPVWAQNHRTPRLASFVALGVWILALVLCSPNLYFRKAEKSFYDETLVHCFNDYGNDTEVAKKTHLALAASRFVFAFIIPFSIIVMCYAGILWKIQADRLSSSSKPFKVITAVIMTFFLCWFPYHVIMFLETAVYDNPDVLLVLVVWSPLTSSLIYLNSCVNPILYVFMGHDFKERVRRPILSVFENAFAEEPSQGNMATPGVPGQNLRPTWTPTTSECC